MAKNNTSSVDSNPVESYTVKSIDKHIEAPKYSDGERRHLFSLISLLCTAREEREKAREEFDDQKYSDYYDTNRRADLGYLAKNTNKGDKRVSTGHTREKDNTLLSVLLKFGFDPIVFAFDQDNFISSELGHEMSDLIKKTREMEVYEEARELIYREYISQGDVFVEEIIDTPIEVIKEPTDQKWVPGMKIDSFSQKIKRVKGLPIAKVRLIPGKKVYLGDPTVENIEDQPFIFTYEVINRKKAEEIYGKWDRWKNVPIAIDNTEAISSVDQVGKSVWGFSSTNEHQVGVLKYQRKGTNEYQVILNGVPMLPLGYPLTDVSTSGEYTLSQGKFEAIVNFSYSKSQPAKIKFDEDILNNFYKLMILKMEQSLKPPMGNKTGKTLDGNVFLPGSIVNDVSPKQLFPLMTSAGPTQGEFSFFNLVKTSIEDKTINKTFAGQSQGGTVTATQIMEEKQQQMLRLGLALDGIVNLEKRLAWKRIYSIIHKYTDPVREEKIGENMQTIYRNFSFETDIDGQKGVKIFHFTDDDFPEPRQHQKFEQELSKKQGKPVSVTFLNPIQLKALKYIWHIVITPTEKNNGEAESLKFLEEIKLSYEIFGGPEAHNIEYLQQRFGNIKGIDPTKWFNRQAGVNPALLASNKKGEMKDAPPKGGALPAPPAGMM